MGFLVTNFLAKSVQNSSVASESSVIYSSSSCPVDGLLSSEGYRSWWAGLLVFGVCSCPVDGLLASFPLKVTVFGGVVCC